MALNLQQLTPKQTYWHDHLQRCAQRGVSMVDYARAEGLDPRRLYAWRAVLAKKAAGDVPVGKDTSSEFVKAILPPRVACRVVLPNGIVLEWLHGVDRDVLSILAALRVAP
ncbi:MAG: hypothetical protein OEW08_12445 [Gammaproteobacteria bacterium]|nr:hypothetical protein [Gammaproteobacteria bacterium]